VILKPGAQATAAAVETVQLPRYREGIFFILSGACKAQELLKEQPWSAFVSAASLWPVLTSALTWCVGVSPRDVLFLFLSMILHLLSS
jgi:hypothetical protein